jgi:hypothetical protein
VPPPPQVGKRFYHQGVHYPAMGFLNPDPQTSYVESVGAGVAELVRLCLPDQRPKVLYGYSQGAEVVIRFLHQWPADRRHEICLVGTIGSPGRAPGPTLFGTNPTAQASQGSLRPNGHGTGPTTSSWTATGIPLRAGSCPRCTTCSRAWEICLEFAQFLFQFLQTQLGGILLGGGGGLLDIETILALLPQLVWPPVGALKVVATNTHGRYLPMPECTIAPPSTTARRARLRRSPPRRRSWPTPSPAPGGLERRSASLDGVAAALS